MNRKELKVEMLRHEENGDQLASYLGISRQSLSNKLSENNNSDFTQKEISKIIEHYNLSAERAMEIFFANNAS